MIFKFFKQLETQISPSLLFLLIICIIIICINLYIAFFTKRKKVSPSILMNVSLTISIGALIIMILWLMFSKQEALFSALTSLTTLVITVTCTYFQYKLTLIDKSNIDKQKARPEIEVTELAKNNKTKNLSLKFLLRSRTLQTLINVNGEIFLSIDQNANNYEFQKHFDNIGSSPSSKIMNAVIDLDDSNPTEKKVLENEITGFEYLIYFKTISLESCVAVYLHGTDSYMAYYSKKDKTWYKYNHTDKSIPKDQIGIIEKNQK